MPYCLIYMSSAVEFPTQDDLEKLLLEARSRNKADSITGLLLFHDGHFFQVLEGLKNRVIACYDRIKVDDRHSRCNVVRSEAIEIRTFVDWDMAYVPFSSLSAAHQRGFIDLQKINNTGKMNELIQDKYNYAFADSFLSSFRDLKFE